MINLVLYSDQDELNNFFEKDNLLKDTVVITPSPAIADQFRDYLFNERLNYLPTLTISKFINNLIKEIFGNEFKIYRKNELYFNLGTIYRNIKIQNGETPLIEEFLNCFNILTDLKSYTLDPVIFESLLENYPERIAQIIHRFYLVQNSLDLNDEHMGLSKLCEKIRGEFDHQDLQKNNYIFWGFEFITPNQIDFLKALSLRSNIQIFIPKLVYLNSRNTDWPNWIENENVLDLSHDKEEAKIEYINSKVFTSNKVDYLKDLSLLKDTANDPLNYIISGKNIDEDFKFTLNSFGKSFKIPIDFMQSEFENIFNLIMIRFSSSNAFVQIEKLLLELKVLLEEKIQIESVKEIKVIIDIITNLETWKELSEKNTEIDLFTFKLISEITLLDLPRNYFFKGSKEGQNNIFELSPLLSIKNKSITSLNFNKFIAINNIENHLSKIYSILINLGPIKRNELLLEFYQSYLLILSKSAKEHFLMVEENLMHESDFWKNSFQEIEKFDLASKTNIKSELVNKRKRENFERTEKKPSATNLQTYLDCPAKYFERYYQNEYKNIKIHSVLEANELGLIMHEVIAKFGEKELNFETDLIKQYSKNILNNFLTKYQKKISQINQEIYFYEILKASRNTLKFLYELKSEFKIKDWFFEKKLENYNPNFAGSVDFFGINDASLIILDFKRTVGQKYNIKNIINRNLIQLWFYLSTLNDHYKKINLIFGYISLTAIEDSIIFYTQENEDMEIFKKFGIKVNYYKDDLFSQIDIFKDELKELIATIKNDEEFLPIPKNIETCTFCRFNLFCKKDKETIIC